MPVNEISGVQNPVVRHARQNGWTAWKMKIEGRNGCPDYWFFKDRMLLIMEFKKPGKPRQTQQRLRAEELSDQGFLSWPVDDAETGRNMLDDPERYANVLR